MTKTASPEKIFEGISGFIAESRAMLKKGAYMEMEGLDAEVKRLCDAVLKLSAEDRERHADKLEELVTGLTALGKEVIAQRDSVITEMQSVSEHRKASVAYSKTDASDNFGKREDK